VLDYYLVRFKEKVFERFSSLS